jgi:AraC family transcriptional regulator
MTAQHRHFDSYADFYQAEYASVIRRITPLSFATMIAADQTAGDWSDKPTPDFVVARIADGHSSYSVDVGAGRFNGRIRPNDTLVIAPDVYSSIQCAGRHRVQVVALPFAQLKNAVADDLCLPEDGDFGALHAGMLANPAIGQIIGTMFEGVDPAEPAAALFFEHSMLSMMAMLVMDANRQSIKPLQRSGLAPWQVRRATKLIAEREGATVSLAEMAASVGLSAFHFCRAFKQATGVAPHRHQTLLRLQRAQELLANTRLPVIEIALSVGYDTPQGLTRLFQRELGTSPSEWRRQRQRWIVFQQDRFIRRNPGAAKRTGTANWRATRVQPHLV